MEAENINTTPTQNAGFPPPARSLHDICKVVWNVEQKHGLLELEIEGVKCWQSGRMKIFYQLCEAAGLYETPHDKTAGLRKKIRHLWNAVAHNPFLTQRGPDMLVVSHERTKRLNGALVDIYSADYVEALKAKGRRVLVLERANTVGRLGAPRAGGNPRADALLLLDAIYRALAPLPVVSADVEAQIDAAATALDGAFGIQFGLKDRLIREAHCFKAHYRSWRMVLRYLQPKELVLVVGYGLTPLIGAAKDMGIPVTEIQHGVISPYHMAYSYPSLNQPLIYFPDRFLSWGPHWTKDVHFPLPESAVQRIGYAYFRKIRRQYQEIEKVPKRIVVISQGTIGAALADLFWQNRATLESYEVYYKLHPGEYKRWRNYESLVALSKLPNVTVVRDTDLYQLLAEAQFQVGVYSTALYEGIAFGCRTILCDLPGIEYMQHLITEYRVPVCRGNDLDGCLHRSHMKSIPMADIF